MIIFGWVMTYRARKDVGRGGHAVIAVCQQRGWRHRSHPAMSEAVARISAESRDAGDEALAAILDGGLLLLQMPTSISIIGIWTWRAATGNILPARRGSWNSLLSGWLRFLSP